MKLLKHMLLLGIMLPFCAGCVGKPTPDVALPQGTLNAAEVTALFSGQSVESILDEYGRVSLTYYSPDGSLRQLQDEVRRSGEWRVRNDGRICLTFPGSREKCRIIVKEGDSYAKYIAKMNGQHERIISYRSFQKGNLVD